MSENAEGTPGEHQGTPGEHQGTSGNAGEHQGTSNKTGKAILDQIIETLRENDEAKKELYRELRYQLKENVGIDVNVEPYLEKWLGERENKSQKIEDIEIPLREIAENVLQMNEDGYSVYQIASFLNIYPSNVSRILKDRKLWEKAIKKQTIKKLPWYTKILAKIFMR